MKVFQQRVLRWLETTFPSAPWTNLGERRRRFLEEALELLQALGMTREEVGKIADYVFNREPGEATCSARPSGSRLSPADDASPKGERVTDPAQELGGVMVTLGALSGVLGLDMEEEGEREITRVEHPSVRAKVQEKQKAKDATSTVTVELSLTDVEELEGCIGGSANMRLQRDPKCVLFRVVSEAQRRLGVPEVETWDQMQARFAKEDMEDLCP